MFLKLEHTMVLVHTIIFLHEYVKNDITSSEITTLFKDNYDNAAFDELI